MKTYFKYFFLIILILFVIITSFFSGLGYVGYRNRNHQLCKSGMTIKETKDILGVPDRVQLDSKYITNTYYLFLVNKYSYTYSRKDSLLIKKWKEN